MGPFHTVLCSPSQRTLDTAIAMGFAIDGEYQPVDFTDAEYDKLDEAMPPNTPFVDRAKAMAEDMLYRAYAKALRKQWKKLATSLPDGAAALVATHGGYMDNSAVACLPDANHEQWGENFGHCEGIRLAFDGKDFVKGLLLRLEQ